jgi:hypothetical protein
MKKRNQKKLALHRETLAQLEQPDLQQVAGALTRVGCFSGYQTCASCEVTCTTNRC